MNAIDFVGSISKITPSKSDFKNKTDFSDDFIETYINDLCIVKKKANINIGCNNAILDLILNFDLSKFRISTISFNKEEEIIENEKYIFVGWAEAFPFAISKETGEIVELDWYDPTFVVSYIAKDQCSFLDVLIEIEKLSQKEIFEKLILEEEKDALKHIQNIAGGEKYSWIMSFS